MKTDATLNQAIAACRAGQKPQARQLLEQILRHDRSNEAAWLWMSGVVETDDERLACLENVLDINPDNAMARRGLAHLRAAKLTPEVAAGPTPQPAPHPNPGRSAAPTPRVASHPTPLPGPQTTPYPNPQQQQPAAAPGVGSSALGTPGIGGRQVRLQAVSATQPRATLSPALRLLVGATIAVIAAALAYVLVSSGLESIPDISNASGAKEHPSVAEWQSFSPKNGFFDIKLPGTPESDVQPVDTPVGRLNLYVFSVEAGEFFYMVGYADYPPDVVRNADVESMLIGARDGAVANVAGTLVGERRVSLQGFPGRELWIEVTVQGQVGLAQQRMFLVGNRLYQIVVAGPKERFAESSAEKALNSFRVVR